MDMDTVSHLNAVMVGFLLSVSKVAGGFRMASTKQYQGFHGFRADVRLDLDLVAARIRQERQEREERRLTLSYLTWPRYCFSSDMVILLNILPYILWYLGKCLGRYFDR